MLVIAISLAMVVALATSSIIAIHDESEKARVKVAIRKGRVLR